MPAPVFDRGLIFLDKLQSDNNPAVLLLLLKVEHPDLPAPLYFVRDTLPVTSRGNTYQPFPFNFVRPGHGEDAPIQARLTLDNISQEMAEFIRALGTPPTLTLELVLGVDPDTVEQPFPPFTMQAVAGDRLQITADLQDADDDAEPLCKWTFTPAFAPALFR